MALFLHRAYAGFAWGMIALGLVHITASTQFYDHLTQAALWFVSGGLVIILTGALNLLNRAYGRLAPGLRRVTQATNLIMSAFALLTGIVGHASPIEIVVIVGLFAGTLVLALTPGALTNDPSLRP